jgi:hypothetical protein
MRSAFPVAREAVAEQGSKGLPVNFDFTPAYVIAAGYVINGDLTVEMQQNQISLVQAIWIDNRLNASPFVITFLGLNYALQVRAGRQGTYPVIATSGPLRFTAVSVNSAVVVPTVMFNFNETPWWQDV